MLGDPNDPLAVEHEPPQVRELLQRYIDGEIELEEAESRIDWDVYVGEEGAKHRKEDELFIKQRGEEALRLKKLVDADIERLRVRRKAKAHRASPVDHIERVKATLPWHRRPC